MIMIQLGSKLKQIIKNNLKIINKQKGQKYNQTKIAQNRNLKTNSKNL